MKKEITLILFLGVSTLLSATNIQVENVRMIYRPELGMAPSIQFDLSWDNAWHNDRNHDAAWVFFKYNLRHFKITQSGHRILDQQPTGIPDAKLEVAKDGMGLFVYPDKNYRGRVHYRLQVQLDMTDFIEDRQQLKKVHAFALEMVYIPAGPFTLGDPDSLAHQFSSFYRSDAQGQMEGLYHIDSEKQIDVGPEKDKLYYQVKRPIYNGDQKGPVPAEFPKGYNAFYIMKYELQQGQYADFLNRIYSGDTYVRAGIAGVDYDKNKGTIVLEEGIYKAGSPTRPMNFVSWEDGIAYTDWAGLRPLTELEYTKAARGPEKPIAGGFVWGTANYDRIARFVNPEGELVMANGWDESQLTDATRPVFGASYYWVMDLSGSVWEKVITIGNELGRQFKGSHGDGRLSFGQADNEDWPKSNDEVGGYGYRGGGYYEIGTYYDYFNPHSPVAYRTYGSWSGGPRSIAYGFRAGRSVD
ncbi:MAG: hypothetical protein DHS20C18_11480 [Saprospiraceae bacterium]|nr:MAG: hypothetical protein DHS20C18_11480 [Saprospiraceae bacterium]